jgi:ribonuclease T1
MVRKGWNWRTAVMAVLLVVSAGLSSLSPSAAHARVPFFGPQVGMVEAVQLPPQGRSMLTLIYEGGPFRHEKDGVVFGNRERILPISQRGFYREYTVRTPGERSRGARRIVCGGFKPAAPDACYYTDDHYASFRRIVQ